MNNAMRASSALEAAKTGESDPAESALALLTLAIELLEQSEHAVVICYAQMARDLLVGAICPEISFSAGMSGGGTV